MSKFIKIVTRSKFVKERLINISDVKEIITEIKQCNGERSLYLLLNLSGDHILECKLKHEDSNIMSIITEFLENDDTVLDITRYLNLE